MSPFRGCAAPGCPALVRVGTGARCPTHAADAAAQRDASDAARRADPARIYATERWRTFRRWFLARHPLCVDCGGLADTVDHLETVRARPDLAFVEDNCRPRCASCHSRRTSREHSWNRR